jgi:hypothetical protein
MSPKHQPRLPTFVSIIVRNAMTQRNEVTSVLPAELAQIVLPAELAQIVLPAELAQIHAEALRPGIGLIAGG